MKVSVVIPVYNVERFIGKNVRSLLSQTLDDVEFIFVDDASTDGSVGIIRQEMESFPGRNVRIIRHDANKGLPSARNTGMAAATGDYIYHCDSDDWLETDMLELLYERAVGTGADFVYCDFYLSFGNNERYMSNPAYENAGDVLTRGFLGGNMKYNVWNKLVRRRLYTDNGIAFPDGHSMGEDMTMIKVVSLAGSVAYVPRALYHYVKLNTEAFSNSMTERKLDDIIYNTESVIEFLKSHLPGLGDEYISMFKLNVKLPFLVSGKKEQFELWKSWYPESNAYAMCNRNLPFRTRLLQYMAAHGCWWYVRLYHLLVFKVVYGIMYR